MIMMRFKLFGGFLLTLSLLLVFSGVAGATILPPGGTVSPVPLGTETGVLVATATGSYSTTTLSGTVSEAVYAVTGPTASNSPSGAVVCAAGATCLDFVYQFTQSNSARGVNAFTVSDFDNVAQWITDVYQSNTLSGSLNIPIFSTPGGRDTTASSAGEGGQGPDQTTLFAGDTVGFQMPDGGTYGASDIFIIQTNAPDYVVGSVSLISNTTATSNVPSGNLPWSATYTGNNAFSTITNTNPGGAAFAFNGVGYSNSFLAPIAPLATPEPGFYGILAIGLGGIYLVLKLRRKKQAV
jgi:hypothetical protein